MTKTIEDIKNDQYKEWCRSEFGSDNWFIVNASLLVMVIGAILMWIYDELKGRIRSIVYGRRTN
jgi:hypothetical protein